MVNWQTTEFNGRLIGLASLEDVASMRLVIVEVLEGKNPPPPLTTYPPIGLQSVPSFSVKMEAFNWFYLN